MERVDYLGFIYASLVACGGIVGYLKAGSVPSLAAGLGFGAVSAFGAYQVSDKDSHIVLLCSSGVLFGVMGARFYKSKKFMPAGLVALLSLGILGRSIYSYALKN